MSVSLIYKKIWLILTPGQHRRTVFLFFLMLLGMILETLGISLVLPALAFMSQSDLSTQFPFLKIVVNYFGNPSHRELVVIGVITLGIVYTFKALFLGWLAWMQAKFSFEVMASISHQLFNNYLNRSYTFHLQHNSAQLIRNVTGEVSVFNTVTQSVLTILTESLVFIGITLFLFFIEPVGALFVMIILGIAGLVFYVLTRKLILNWGVQRQLHEGLRIQHLQQGLGGVKDVKLFGRESEFLAKFQIHNARSAKVGELQATIKALPRHWLEFLAILGLVSLVFIMIGKGKPLDSFVPMLGVFVAAAFRVMPSVNRVLTAFQTVKYAVPVIDLLYEELQEKHEIKIEENYPPLDINDSIILNNVSFQYPVSESPAIENINIKIPYGSMTGFIGTTGAGKTTLIDLILGLLKPQQGEILVDGINIHSNLRGWQDQIGYVPQSIYLTDDSLRRNIAFGIPDEEIDEISLLQAIHDTQLDSFVENLSQGLDTTLGERGVRLSGGQKQRIGIARALYHDPKVIVLDEATSSLDIDTEAEVMKAVDALHGDKTILVIAHRLSTVEKCDQLYRLEKSKIVEEGSPDTLLRTTQLA